MAVALGVLRVSLWNQRVARCENGKGRYIEPYGV